MYTQTADESGAIWAVILIALVVAIVFGMIGAWIGGNRERRAAGFWLGFFLGPIGLIVAALLDRPATDSMSAAQPSTPSQNDAQGRRLRAIEEAIRRDPMLTSDTPEALAHLASAANSIEAEWETQRIRDEVMSRTEGERNGDLWVPKPEGVVSEWNGSQWLVKPEGIESNWSGSEWVPKPDRVISEWNGQEWLVKPSGVEAGWSGSEWLTKPTGVEAYWVTSGATKVWAVKPADVEAHWNGEAWVPRPKGPSSWNDERGRWTRPWYLGPVALGFVVALAFVGLVSGLLWVSGGGERDRQRDAQTAWEDLTNDQAYGALEDLAPTIAKNREVQSGNIAQLAKVIRVWNEKNPQSRLVLTHDEDRVLIAYNPDTSKAACMDVRSPSFNGQVRLCQPDEVELTRLT